MQSELYNPLPIPHRFSGESDYSYRSDLSNAMPMTPTTASSERRFMPSGSVGSRQSSMSGSSRSDGNVPFRSSTYSEQVTEYSTTEAFIGLDSAPEPDDWLHNPEYKDAGNGTIFTCRGLANLGFILLLVLGLLMLFAGYPILAYFRSQIGTGSSLNAFNLGGVNGSGQVPSVIGNFGLIDPDTPREALTRVANNGKTWELVFSDEFNVEGRSFYPGDDPYWEAVDLHAWATGDLEWYDPKAVTTRDGKLVITLSDTPHRGEDYTSGHLQSWNKFCFTGGRLEVATRFPGQPNVVGLWPSAWALGNLGRAGYGGTLDGLWPYASYNECDIGTLPNQTLNGAPEIAATSGPWNTPLSFLPGQRLSRCTCPDDPTHPGPRNPDGSFVGRSAPEIDVFEAQIDTGLGQGFVSQSAQWAPFNPFYIWDNVSFADIIDPSITSLNGYAGGNLQETSSAISRTNDKCYQYTRDGLEHDGCFDVQAFEYQPGEDGYISWFNADRHAWSYLDGGFNANDEAQVGYRGIPDEPMSIILQLAFSENFGGIDWENLKPLFPYELSFDYVRVYQDPEHKNIGCEGKDRPTAGYIDRYKEGYSNYNLTTWDQMTNSEPKPVNRLTGTCAA